MPSVNLKYGGETITISVPAATEVGHIRTKQSQLEDLGVPSNYTLDINGQGVADSVILQDGDNVSFRAISATKGC